MPRPDGRIRGQLVLAATARSSARCSSAPLIVVVAFEGVQSLDVTGPVEVFTRAGQLADEPYAVEVVGPTAGRCARRAGSTSPADRALAEVRGALDTLVVAGGDGTQPALRDRRRRRRRAAGRSPGARGVASVCTGAFLLAEAGLLDGRRATTHWDACARSPRAIPKVSVDPDPIFVRDGRVWTSAGVTAGMDLALALVEEDHGREVALGVARELVLFLQRPGGQSQFSAQLAGAGRRARAAARAAGLDRGPPERGPLRRGAGARASR